MFPFAILCPDCPAINFAGFIHLLTHPPILAIPLISSLLVKFHIINNNTVFWNTIIFAQFIASPASDLWPRPWLRLSAAWGWPAASQSSGRDAWATGRPRHGPPLLLQGTGQESLGTFVRASLSLWFPASYWWL